MKVYELVESSKPYVGFHGTLTANIPGIKKDGLKSDLVYLATTFDGAVMWAKALHGEKSDLSIVKVRHDKKPVTQVIQVHKPVPPEDILEIKKV